MGWRVLFGGGGEVESAVWGWGWGGECCLVRYVHTSICVLPVFWGRVFGGGTTATASSLVVQPVLIVVVSNTTQWNAVTY